MARYHGVMHDRDLPEELVLPLATGEPWWYWSGGRPAVDFVNTRRERWRRGVETLVTPEDLATWLVPA
jgi:Putative stress-induced transcription regulator